MRVLIADRNAWLLEAVARTFAHDFSIQTATSHEQCNELLRREAFDLAVVSEKLADGAGVELLAQMLRDSPDTLRVFAARRSRLEMLQGKLGCFGLFRTLSYPIEPQALMSALSLARAALQVDLLAGSVALPGSAAAAGREADGAKVGSAPVGAARKPARHAEASKSGTASARHAGSSNSGSEAARHVEASRAAVVAAWYAEGPMSAAGPVGAARKPARHAEASRSGTASARHAGLSNSGSVPSRHVEASQAAGVAVSYAEGPTSVAAPVDAARKPARHAGSFNSGSVPAPVRATVERISLTSADAIFAADVRKTIAAMKKVPRSGSPAARPAATATRNRRRAESDSPAQQPSQAQRPAPATRETQRAEPTSPQPPAPPLRQATQAPLSSQSDAFKHAALDVGVTNRARPKQLVPHRYDLDRSPGRTKVLLGATVLMAFLVTAVTLNRVDASAHDTRGTVPNTERPQHDQPAPPPSLPPLEGAQPFGPTQSLARQAAPQPAPTKAHEQAAAPQLAAAAAPIADPSTFGSEAYEPIYAN